MVRPRRTPTNSPRKTLTTVNDLASMVLLGIVFVGCAETAPNPLEPRTSVQTLQPPSLGQNPLDTIALPGVGGEGAEDEALRQFDLTLTIRGALKPGVPFSVQAAVRGLIESDDVQLVLVSPEAEMLRRGLRGTVPPSFNADDSWRGGLSSGNTITRGINPQIDEPGYYRFMAFATDMGDDRTDDGLLIHRAAFKELWAYIDEAGGVVTPVYDTTVFHDSEHKAPGPRRRQGIPNQLGVLSAAAAGSACVTGEVSYMDLTMQSRPVPRAQLSVNLSGSLFFSETDANGVYSICGQAGQSVFAVVETVHDDFSIHYDAGAHLTIWLGTISETLTTGTITRDLVATDNEAGKLFADFDYVIPQSRTLMGHSRGFIPVYLSNTATGSSYNSFYDRIVMEREGVMDPGGNGIVVVAHEYGHALHELALDDIHGSGVGNTCPSPHFMEGAYDMHCAYTEGFADFHGAFVTGAVVSTSAFGDWRTERNDRNWYWQIANLCPPSGPGPCTPYGDGSMVEAAFAAFLYDLVDGPTSPNSSSNTSTGSDDDPLELPGKYVADIIRTCRVNANGWRDAEWVDEFVWCFQRQVTHQRPFFGSRTSNFATSFSESAVEGATWTTQRVKDLWKLDLYRVPVGTIMISATINGPGAIIAGQNGTWTVNVSGGVMPYTYRWYKNGVLVSTGSSYTGTGSVGQFELEVGVLGATGGDGQHDRVIAVTDGGGGWE